MQEECQFGVMEKWPHTLESGAKAGTLAARPGTSNSGGLTLWTQRLQSERRGPTQSQWWRSDTL